MSSVRSEREVRLDLAAAYRLAAARGWDDIVYTHISASVPGEPGVYLINRFGLRFDEITASNLVKVNVHGELVDGSGARVSASGFAIHGCVHAARPELECVMHLHSPWGLALSMTPEGLLPTSQFALRLHGRIARHAYEGLAFDVAEQARLVKELGSLDGLLLDHHGTLTAGRTVGEAFVLMHLFERAAEAQLRAMAACGGQVPRIGETIAQRTHQQWVGDGSARDGDDEWPALRRGLDRTAPDYRD